MNGRSVPVILALVTILAIASLGTDAVRSRQLRSLEAEVARLREQLESIRTDERLARVETQVSKPRLGRKLASSRILSEAGPNSSPLGAAELQELVSHAVRAEIDAMKAEAVRGVVSRWTVPAREQMEALLQQTSISDDVARSIEAVLTLEEKQIQGLLARAGSDMDEDARLEISSIRRGTDEAVKVLLSDRDYVAYEEARY